MAICELFIPPIFYMIESPLYKYKERMMLMEQEQVSVISINAFDKKIKLGRMESLDGDRSPLFSFRKLADIEDGISLYAVPFVDMKSGEKVSSKCFICTEDDIIETEGIGFIPFDNEDKAVLYMDKLEKMIEWQQ